MAKDMHEAWKEVEESNEYNEFKQKEEGYTLVHAYTEEENNIMKPWEFGFYNPGQDKMIVFHTEPIKKGAEEEVYKEEGTIKPLDINKVKVSLDQALVTCEALRREKYISQLVSKKIIILQNLHKQLWNITMLTRSFHIINVKIDAETGEILSSNINSVMDLGLRKI